MGALGITNRPAVDHSDDAPPPDATTDDQAGAGTPDDGFVPAAALVPETRDSRRRRIAKEEMESTLAPLKEEWSKKETTYQQDLGEERRLRQQQAEQLAQMRGTLEAMQRQSQQVQQSQQPAKPDPSKLFEEAEAALVANDIRGYHAKIREATRIEAESLAETKTAAMRAEIQRQMPPQMPPHIQQLMFQNPAVAAAGEKGIRAVIRAEQELDDDGEQPGLARLTKAFATASAKFTKAKPVAAAKQSFGQDGAAALSGIPTSRGANGSSASSTEDGVQLSQAQKAAAKAAGMSAQEYVRWGDPRKFGLIKD